MEAVRFLSKNLRNNPRFIGEDPFESPSSSILKNINDNKIIISCLKLREQVAPAMVLFITNDLNLESKCLVIKLNVTNFEKLVKMIGPNFVNLKEYKEKRKKRMKEMEEKSKMVEKSVEENAESSFSDSSSNEENVVVEAILEDNLVVMNYLIGMICDEYSTSDDFGEFVYSKHYSKFIFNHILFLLYPPVKKMKCQLEKILESLTEKKRIKEVAKEFAETLRNFIPSLNLPYKEKAYPTFTTKVFLRWTRQPQNRKQIEEFALQVEYYFSKLRDVLDVILDDRCISSPDI